MTDLIQAVVTKRPSCHFCSDPAMYDGRTTIGHLGQHVSAPLRKHR